MSEVKRYPYFLKWLCNISCLYKLFGPTSVVSHKPMLHGEQELSFQVLFSWILLPVN